MEPNFEQSIPIPAIIAAFVILTILSRWIQIKIRQKKLVREGQLPLEGTELPSVEKRLAGNAAWSSGTIRAGGKKVVLGMSAAALVWNLFFGLALVKTLENPAGKTGGIVVLGIFIALGVAFAVFTYRAIVRYRRFGESHCCIKGKAGVTGETMTGVIRTEMDVPATGDYTFELQCIDTYSHGSGKKRKTETVIEWQEKKVVSHSGKSSRSGIPFSFEIPRAIPETGYQLARGTITWNLRIHAPVEGVDYAAQFVIPVFKTK